MMTGEVLLEKLKSYVGQDFVLTDSDLSDRYEHIWSMDQGLQAIAVVLPSTTEEFLCKAMIVSPDAG